MNDLNYITALLEKRSFFSEYQPLWNTETNSIFAYEAFFRIEDGTSPLVIFQDARDAGLLYELDTASIQNAIKNYPFFKKYFLFVNVFPSSLIHDKFPMFIKGLMNRFPEIKGEIIFEINEAALEEDCWNKDIFSDRLEFLRSSGFQIAFDDLPITELSLTKIRRHEPEFVKLDHTYSIQLSESLVKQQSIEYLLSYINRKNMLVLEGIETAEDLLVARNLGVPLLQGYYIAKPVVLDSFQEHISASMD
ncbi:diguanylate phosphodiesterase [Bacillus sp. V3-13]|uniref:EAL domain-containing protein n=1 Tax=Bacillus sp. V3-13 TaxID=2053728 RepID=UPI000C77B18B|nr:EAL domain-containing protein [Bacillus sp. V3-13]PLR75943.1 diguanylate phosphodiesterase [Bacillus sp. V3-13]